MLGLTELSLPVTGSETGVSENCDRDYRPPVIASRPDVPAMIRLLYVLRLRDTELLIFYYQTSYICVLHPRRVHIVAPMFLLLLSPCVRPQLFTF